MKNFPLAVVISGVDRISAPLARIGGQLNSFAVRASKLGASMSLGITAPVVGLFTLATSKALETDRAMARLAATSGATGAALEAAAKQANNVPGDFDPKDGLDALTQMGKLGLSLSESLAALPLTTNLAVAAEADLAETSKLTLKVLRAYGLELEQVAAVTDLLAQANASSDLGLAGVAEGLVTLSPLAHELGLEVADVAASVLALGKAGQEPIAVLRGAMAGLIKPSKAAAEAFVRLRIRRGDLFNSKNELRSMAEVVEVLGSHGAEARDLLDIFGKRAGPGMAALLQQGSASLKATATNLGKVGAAASQAAVRLNSTEGALWDLDNTLDDLKLTVAKSGLLENISKAAKELSRLARAANDLDPRIIELGLSAVALAAVLGPVIWLGAQVVKGFGMIAGAAEFLGAALVPVAAALGLPFELVAALALALPAAIIYWDDLTAALARFITKFDAVKSAANWIEENLLFGKHEAFGHVLTDEDKKRFDSWMPIDRAPASKFDSWLPANDPGRSALQRMNQRGSGGSAPAPAAEVNVRFENAPAGTRASVQKATGVDVGLDMGWAMIPG